MSGKTLIYATTNGTVALKRILRRRSRVRRRVAQRAAVVRHIAAHHRDGTIVIVCSGSMGNPNLEDMYGAGYFVELIARELGEGAGFLRCRDRRARAVPAAKRPRARCCARRVGQLMQERGLTHEVEYAAQLSPLNVVPKLVDGVLKPV